MNELEREELLGRLKKFQDKMKNVKSETIYHLYADEGGMIGTPSFWLIRQNSIKKKAPAHHIYQCLGNGDFMKTYIQRLIEMWYMAGNGNFLESFKIEVIN